MPHEPPVIRAIAFIDGQNLYHAAREAFGYTYPNYDVGKLAQAVCATKGWQLNQTRFYTGVPDLQDNAFWHGFWTNKLLAMRRTGISVFSRALRYRNVVPVWLRHLRQPVKTKAFDTRIDVRWAGYYLSNHRMLEVHHARYHT